MKVLVTGFESSEDISKKTGNAYAIGKIYACVKLDGRNVEGKFICKGAMGAEYQVDCAIVKRIAHLPLPFEAEMVMEDVMRFGKRESKCMDCVPVARAPASASTAMRATAAA